MCGICGVFALDGSLDPEVTRAVPAMNAAIAHRGPDGDGFFRDPRAVLGHRRLAIIDRAGGHQLMSNEDGRARRGFTASIGEWIAGPLAARFRDDVLHAGTIVANHLDMKELGNRFQVHCAGHRIHAYTLWSVRVAPRRRHASGGPLDCR
jgi:hypothetical protein